MVNQSRKARSEPTPSQTKATPKEGKPTSDEERQYPPESSSRSGKGPTSDFDCKDLTKYREEKRRRRNRRRKDGRERNPLANAHPSLFLATVDDPDGRRLPGDAMSVATEIGLDGSGKPWAIVRNAGHFAAYGAFVEFLVQPPTQPRTARALASIEAIALDSVPPRSGVRVQANNAMPVGDGLLVVRAWALSDPPRSSTDLGDRHLAQFGVGWRPSYKGTVTRSTANPADADWNGQIYPVRIRIDETRGGRAGQARVRAHHQVGGKLSEHPTSDVVVESLRPKLRIETTHPFAIDVVELTLIDSQTLHYHEWQHFTDGSRRPDFELYGDLQAE